MATASGKFLHRGVSFTTGDSLEQYAAYSTLEALMNTVMLLSTTHTDLDSGVKLTQELQYVARSGKRR